jgi:hypothetical protein
MKAVGSWQAAVFWMLYWLQIVTASGKKLLEMNFSRYGGQGL